MNSCLDTKKIKITNFQLPKLIWGKKRIKLEIIKKSIIFKGIFVPVKYGSWQPTANSQNIREKKMYIYMYFFKLTLHLAWSLNS